MQLAAKPHANHYFNTNLFCRTQQDLRDLIIISPKLLRALQFRFTERALIVVSPPNHNR